MGHKDRTDYWYELIVRFFNYAGARHARVVASIPINSSEQELLTAANPAIVGGSTAIAEASCLRPDNATQYAAGDQIANAVPEPLELAVPRIDGGTGVIIYAVCADSANQATKLDLRLYLFDTLPTIVADNLAWTPSDADMVNSIGFIDFSAWEIGLATAGADGNCNSYAANLDIPFVCTAGVIYGLLVVRNAYTPVASELFSLRLGVLQD